MNLFCDPTVTVFFKENFGNIVESIVFIVSQYVYVFCNVTELTGLVSQGNSYWHCLVSLQWLFSLFAIVSSFFVTHSYCLTVISAIWHGYMPFSQALSMFFWHFAYILDIWITVNWDHLAYFTGGTDWPHIVTEFMYLLSVIILHHIWSVMCSHFALFH